MTLLVISITLNIKAQTKQPVLRGKEKVKMFAKQTAMADKSSFKDLY